MKLFLVLMMCVFISSASSDICNYCKCKKDLVDCSEAKEEVSLLLKTYGNPDLQKLVVKKKTIGKLSAKVFIKLPNLKEIVLENCKISEISDYTFSNLHRLIKVNLASNNLNHIKLNAFKGADMLQTLNLAGNKLTSIPILSNPNLKTLNLASNKLTKCYVPEEFKNTHLEDLTLASNEIAEISAGDFKYSKYLKKLNLYFNPISMVANHSFNIPNLAVLKMGSKTGLESNKFCPIFSDLKDNKFHSLKIRVSVSEPLPKGCHFPSHVVDLNLAGSYLNPKFVRDLLEPMKHNIANMVLDNCFHNSINGLKFPVMKSLKRLQFRNNRVDTLRDDLFSELQSLEQLDLSACYIRSIEDDAFDGLFKLRFLDLSKNTKLVFLPGVIAGMKLDRLDLAGTNLVAIKSCADFGRTCVRLSKDQNISGCVPSKKWCNCQCTAGKAQPSTVKQKPESTETGQIHSGWIALMVLLSAGGVATPMYIYRRKIRSLVKSRNDNLDTVRFDDGRVYISPADNSQSNGHAAISLPDAPRGSLPLPTVSHPPEPVTTELNAACPLPLPPRHAVDALMRYKHNKRFNQKAANIQFIPTGPPPIEDANSSTYDRLSAGTVSTDLIAKGAARTEEENDDDEERLVNNLGYHMSDFKYEVNSSSSVDLSSNGSLPPCV